MVPVDREFDPSQHLLYVDVVVDNVRQPLYLAVHIKRSKTDHFWKGVQVIIGRTSDSLCSITANTSIVGVKETGKGPLFWFKDGRPLTRVCCVSQVREAL